MKKIWYKLLLVVIFGIVMGYLEAVTVVYMRQILTKLPYPLEPMGEVIQKLMKEPLYFMEQVREAATIAMIVTFAWLVGKNWWEKMGIFLLIFGIWDIFYYIFLYMLLRWPPSLTTIDVLFLIPVPWIAPVYVPVGISLIMIFISLYVLFKKANGLAQQEERR